MIHDTPCRESFLDHGMTIHSLIMDEPRMIFHNIGEPLDSLQLGEPYFVTLQSEQQLQSLQIDPKRPVSIF